MRVALVYGAALLGSGLLLAAGVTQRCHNVWLQRLHACGSASKRAMPRSANWVAAFGRNRQGVLATVVSAAGALLGRELMGPVGMLAGLSAGPLLARARQKQADTARRDLLDRQLGEAVDTIAASVRAGLSVRRAVGEAAMDVASPLRDELSDVVEALSAGEPLDRALSRLDRNLRLVDARLLVTALGVHRRTGGDLPTLLAELGRVIRARREDRRSIRALTTQARSSGVVLAVLPVGFVALLSGTGGDGLGAFYRSLPGGVLLGVALGCQVLGFAWMRKIVERVDAS